MGRVWWVECGGWSVVAGRWSVVGRVWWVECGG